MNWMICYDYGKDSDCVYSDMIKDKDNAVDALKAYQEKYDNEEIRIVAVVPVDRDTFKDLYNINDDEKFSRCNDTVARMRKAIAADVGSYENERE